MTIIAVVVVNVAVVVVVVVVEITLRWQSCLSYRRKCVVGRVVRPTSGVRQSQRRTWRCDVATAFVIDSESNHSFPGCRVFLPSRVDEKYHSMKPSCSTHKQT